LIDDSDDIQVAAERAIGPHARFARLTPVSETCDGAVVWQGVVSEFQSAQGTVYIWAVEGTSGTQFVTVLRRGTVLSPLAAVRAWLKQKAG
jgi:hypothetical protein